MYAGAGPHLCDPCPGHHLLFRLPELYHERSGLGGHHQELRQASNVSLNFSEAKLTKRTSLNMYFCLFDDHCILVILASYRYLPYPRCIHHLAYFLNNVPVPTTSLTSL